MLPENQNRASSYFLSVQWKKTNRRSFYIYISRLGTLFTNWISQFKFLQLPMSPFYNGEQQQRIYLCAAETGWSGRESVRVGGERQLGFGGQTRYWVSQNLPHICTASAEVKICGILKQMQYRFTVNIGTLRLDFKTSSNTSRR